METFAQLVAPLSEAEFMALLRARTPLVQRGAGAGRYGRLADWEGFLRAVEAGEVPREHLRITQRGSSLPPFFWHEGATLAPGLIRRVLGQGGSVIAYGLETGLPSFTRLCADVAARTGERVTGGLIASTGEGGALRPHYDEDDLIVLQIEGRKRWIVESEPETDPVRGLAEPPVHVRKPPCIDTVLEPGDWLFLPAGHWHRCETQDGRSLHAGIFLWPLTAQRALDLVARSLIDRPDARKPLRGGVDEAVLKDRLIEAIRQMPLDELMARHRDRP